ncbi:hypothetical protein COU60_04140 [Candidatus Pacearchaeota archaeon CG10_big_fil_rev_8_21_14_0_10_34_76]|nr:MAG: hypothetical protein COU60_04140 [Candidatus Pacearchaeota archaeon CG10_big_fil_rev_8_21_14_0_10_34_76]
MIKKEISSGVVHTLPEDLRNALTSNKEVLGKWENLTPLSRNEWICWVISVKKDDTRKEHIDRLINELKEGKRRPCCWLGCIHRKDKSLSPSVRGILHRRSKKFKKKI